MSDSPPPPHGQSKSGLGCLGIGCIVVLVLLLLFLGLVGAVCYYVYSETISLTSPSAIAVQTFDGGDAMYAATQQKLTDFDHDLKNHKPATLRLSADEINTMIAHNPDLTKSNVHIFVSMEKDEARVQVSAPTDLLTNNLIKGRFANADATFKLKFDSTAKTVGIKIVRIKAANRDVPKQYFPPIEEKINPAIDQGLQGEDVSRNMLESAKTIEIKDGELEIDTE